MKLIVALVAFFSFSVVFAMAPSVPKLPPVERNDIQMMVSTYAFIYKVDETLLHKVIHCESSHNPNAENITSREESYGLVQINRLAHPHISIVQAKDPQFAIEFLAKNISLGKGRMWSCYTQLTNR